MLNGSSPVGTAEEFVGQAMWLGTPPPPAVCGDEPGLHFGYRVKGAWYSSFGWPAELSLAYSVDSTDESSPRRFIRFKYDITAVKVPTLFHAATIPLAFGITGVRPLPIAIEVGLPLRIGVTAAASTSFTLASRIGFKFGPEQGAMLPSIFTSLAGLVFGVGCVMTFALRISAFVALHFGSTGIRTAPSTSFDIAAAFRLRVDATASGPEPPPTFTAAAEIALRLGVSKSRPLMFDSFVEDPATFLLLHTPDFGPPWAADATFIVGGGKVTYTGTEDPPTHAIVNLGMPDVRITVDMHFFDHAFGVVLRFVDAENFLLFRVQNIGTWQLVKIEGGSGSVLIEEFSVGTPTPTELEIVCRGDIITCTANHVTQEATGVTFNETSTLFGLGTDAPNNTGEFDNFRAFAAD